MNGLSLRFALPLRFLSSRFGLSLGSPPPLGLCLRLGLPLRFLSSRFGLSLRSARRFGLSLRLRPSRCRLPLRVGLPLRVRPSGFGLLLRLALPLRFLFASTNAVLYGDNAALAANAAAQAQQLRQRRICIAQRVAFSRLATGGRLMRLAHGSSKPVNG